MKNRILTLAAAAGCALALAAPVRAGNSVAQLVDDHRALGSSFGRVAPFAAAHGVAAATAADVRGVLREGSVFAADRANLAGLRRSAPETMTLVLPNGRSNVVLELVRVELFTPDFAALTSEGIEVDRRALGVHYRGVVQGEKDSLASISVFDREIAGFASSPGLGFLVLGRLGGENPRNEHVLYPTRALVPQHNWSCEMADAAASEPSLEEFLNLLDVNQSRLDGSPTIGEAATAASRCVRVYVEADYDLYQQFGSAANVTSFLSGLFAQSATIYANDGISIKSSEFNIWTRRSPYKGNSSSALLASFQKNRKTFNGDLGHLVTLKNTGGVAAGFAGLCAGNRANSQCYSGLDPTYNSVPTYSWSVMVFTHEMGHLMGSRHTHACVWNGNNTQIDGCYTPEGTCPRLGNPQNGGTIMSYCHLQPVGTNFSNGFGPQPKGVITNNVNGSVGSCLPASCN